MAQLDIDTASTVELLDALSRRCGAMIAYCKPLAESDPIQFVIHGDSFHLLSAQALLITPKLNERIVTIVGSVTDARN